MARAGRDLVGQHLDHDRRLEPDVWYEVRADAGGLVPHLEAGKPPVDVAPALVGQAGAKFGDGHELVLVAVVDAGEQGARTELRALALAAVVPEQHDIDGVSEL